MPHGQYAQLHGRLVTKFDIEPRLQWRSWAIQEKCTASRNEFKATGTPDAEFAYLVPGWVPLKNPVIPKGPGTKIELQLLYLAKPLPDTRVSFIPRGETLD